MTELPRGWARTSLEEIAEVRLGRQRSPKNHAGANMRPYLRAANVSWQGLRLDDVKEMNFTDEEAETYRLRPGDIVLGEASGSASEVGKPALWQGEIADCCFQNTLIRVRSLGVEPRYLVHYLRHEALRGAFIDNSRGVGIHHVGVARIAKWPIDVPPLAEQHRIVTELEDRLSRLDAIEAGVEACRRRLMQLKKRILVDAVPVPGPAHWQLVKVEDAGTVSLGRQRHPDWHTGTNMRKYLRVANVFEDRIDTSDLMEMDFPPAVFEKFKLEVGDILLNEGQSPEYLGRPALYRGQPEDVAYTNSLLRFKAGPSVDPEWALLVFRRHMHARRFIQEVRITTNIAHLSAARFKSVEFPIPPLSEQSEIIALTKERLEVLDRLTETVDKAASRLQRLRRATLCLAFSGQLVPQAPEESPAAELLDSIRAHRVTKTKTRKSMRKNPAQEALL